MGDNNKEIGKNSKIDSQSEKSEILEKLDSHKRKFDEIAEKLQSMEKSISKIPKFDEKPKSAKNFVLKHVFNNVIEFEEDKYNYSEWETHFNVNWRISVKRLSNYLAFYTHCKSIAPSCKWSIQTKFEFKAAGRNQNVIKTSEYCYEENNGYGFHQFLGWEEMKNGYLVNGNLTVEVEVRILKMTGFGKEILRNFNESIKDCSDVELVVKDRKFYLCKMFLALQSSYFKSLLLGNFEESQKKEIELKDIDPDDFQNFLELIHGESSIDDDTVSGILQLADMYDVPTAIRRCEEFLLEKSTKSAKKLFEMAARYNLENLKEKCMSGIKTFADFQSILPGEIETLNHSLMAELLKKSRTL
ncbi:hypothetical protein B9Z55_007753 [Caenorhabditis nigoni]|nr:hypothetical protein B9Z55_007753 [Caenorhabditis nigoni]